MSAYDELAAIDRSIRDGDTTLVEVLDFLRTMRLTNFSRDQIVAATACNDLPAPTIPPAALPVPPKPAPIRAIRRA